MCGLGVVGSPLVHHLAGMCPIRVPNTWMDGWMDGWIMDGLYATCFSICNEEGGRKSDRVAEKENNMGSHGISNTAL